ncbi:MAG: thermonuclease family protein, partial [Neisseriaceae bacterium]|nr:thermonuclease family protein [Neisseriaceae bacterium]
MQCHYNAYGVVFCLWQNWIATPCLSASIAFDTVFIFQAACTTPANATTCTVIKVADGDSFTCRMKSGKKQFIRMSGIDAPEIKQAYGQNARRALNTALLGK